MESNHLVFWWIPYDRIVVISWSNEEIYEQYAMTNSRNNIIDAYRYYISGGKN